MSTVTASVAFEQRLRQSFADHALLPAIECANERFTYAELDAASGTLARTLVHAGVQPGDIVPLLLERSAALIVAQVALLRIGAAYAPIDLASPAARREAMLAQLQPRVAIARSSTEGIGVLDCRIIEVATTMDALVARHRGATDDTVDAATSENENDTWVEWPANALAYVMFTSGTTGAPKAVQIPRSGIARLVCDADFASFHEGARWAFISSPAFDASTLEVWAPLMNGGCCVVQDIAQPSLDDIAAFLIAQRITDAWLTSSLFSALADDRPDAFAGLRQLLTGGERVSPGHARKVMLANPALRLINGYGPTENTTFTLCHAISMADTKSASGIPIGRPVRGTVVRVGTGDDDGGEARGELLASGLGMSLGYLHDDVLNASKFIVVDGSRWYRTGDIVRRRGDDVFEFVGRVDRQIKLQGNRIELDEVERVLESCPGVAQGVVLLRGPTAETRHLVACYSGSGLAPAVELVREYLQTHLPPAAVPAALYPMPHVPLTSTGKVDAHALDALINAGTVRDVASSKAASNAEQTLIAIWQQYLPTALIDRTTNFLTIGGTSLLALQVSSQVRRKTGRNLTPIDVLRLPVLADQARAIETAPLFEFNANGNMPSELELPLNAAQRSMLTAMQLDDSENAFLVHVALKLERMERADDRAGLRRAFVALAARHPSLRMTVRMDGEPTHARVHNALTGPWWNEHDTAVDVPADLAWPAELLGVINRRMDLSRDGVMRVHVWPATDGGLLLVWTVHHLAIDEASIDRALVELDELLNGTMLQPVFGSPLGFATFEKAWTDHDTGALSSRIAHAFAGMERPLPRAPGRGDERPVRVPVELSAHLQQACSRWGITPFAPLLVAYGMALQDVFGAAHRFVSTPFSRRVEAELIEPLGVLLDLNIVEAGTRDGESDEQALARVAGAVLALQRLTFLPHHTVAQAVRRIDVSAAQHLNTFGFTWRINPSRAVRLGNTNAQLLRVPQQGARFGITLHAWLQDGVLQCSVEAIAEAVNDGRATQVGQAFLRRLQALCELDFEPLAARVAASGRALESSAHVAGLADRLRKSWSRWVHMPVANISDSTDFLRSGGNSLTAMRMTAQLRREFGITIDTGAFLARPTFHNLCALAGELTARTPDYCVVMGPADAAHLIVVFPGDIGPTLASYTLAGELQRRLGNNYAVVAVDLETMLLRAPAGGELAFLHERSAQLVTELGRERVAAIAGFSSGGVVALNVAQQWPANAPPVWLLDTYAPPGATQRVLRQLLRPIARGLRKAGLLSEPTRDAETPTAVPLKGIALLRQSVHAEMFGRWQQPRGAEVHLVQALQTARDVRLLWRGASNGFKPAKFERWSVQHVPGLHDELARKFAPDIADMITARLRRVEQRSHADG